MTKETTLNLLEVLKQIYVVTDGIKDAANHESRYGCESQLDKIREDIRSAAEDLKEVIMRHGKFESED